MVGDCDEDESVIDGIMKDRHGSERSHNSVDTSVCWSYVLNTSDERGQILREQFDSRIIKF